MTTRTKAMITGLAAHMVAGLAGGAVVYLLLRAGFAGIW